MENRNGKGIFLGVVSVATLIVAIIGATFAYFSATVTGNNEVNITSYQFAATAAVEKIAPTGTYKDLIPVDSTNVITLANNQSNSNNGSCVDNAGYAACVIYHVTIENSSNAAITLTGELVPKSEDNFTHILKQL